MAQIFPLIHDSIVFEDAQITFYVSGAVTSADVGKAVALDTTAAQTVKLAGAGDTVVGILTTFEDRTLEGVKVGTVALRFCTWLLWDPADVANIGIGKTVVGGATAGTVKAGTANFAVNYTVASKQVGAAYYGLVHKIA